MDYKGVLLVLAFCAYAADALPALVPCFCSRRSEPVCGSDGKTYENQCRLYCTKYLFGVDVNLVNKGPCKSGGGVNVADPLCICPEDKAEVCGSNGITFENSCKLNCATASDPTLRIEHFGKCDDGPKVIGNDCVCTFEYKPVCGTDGNTYNNACTLRCQRSAPDVRVAYEGACVDQVNVVEALCLCGKEKDEVCGSDGKTYENPCKLNCATARDSQLRIEHFGKCEYKPNSDKDGCNICDYQYRPVCGTDGNTYSNECQLRCTKSSPDVQIAYEGECNNEVRVEVPCSCPYDPTPVCGTNGVTYENPCTLNCQKNNNPTLKIKYFKKCGEGVSVETPYVTPPSCICPRSGAPVCGSDGITYNNECSLRCAGVQLAQYAPCEHQGYSTPGYINVRSN